MSRTDNYLAQLRQAVERGEIVIGVNLIKANTPGSPFFRWADNNIPFFVIIVIVAYNFYEGGAIWGLISAVCGIVIFLWLVRRWVMRRVSDRTRAGALSDTILFMVSWRAGLLSLKHVSSGEEIYSPGDDWEQFVLQHVIRGGSQGERRTTR
jgi:hypothetical protein